jgi:cytoskeleton protein RodZ
MKHRSAPEATDQSQNTIDGPGSQLRKARERQGLDQAKVAVQLHLNQSLVQALEWDDYEHLPAAVFVKGYLRNYARLLGVNEDSVIEAFQQLQPDDEKQPLPRNQPDQVAKDLHKGPRLGAYVAIGAVLLVAILVFFWWQGRLDDDTATLSSSDEDMTIEPAFAPEEPADLMPQREGGLPPMGSGAISKPQALDTTKPPMAEDPGARSIEASAPESMPAEPTIREAPVSAPEPAPTETAAPVAEIREPAEAPVQPTAASEGVVVFEFSGPCWVEVRDNTGRARIIGMMRDGIRRTLDAQLGPFRVVIGDIQVVRLSVNGEAYDLARHTRGKVARFTLDPSRL